MAIIKRRSYWYYKTIVIPFKNYFLNRPPLFYFFLLGVILINISLLYGSWWVGDLAYDSEMETLLSKRVLVLLIYIPIAFIFLLIFVIFKILWDRFKRRQGTLLRFKLVSFFLLITLIPSSIYVYVLDYILNEAMDLYFREKTIEAYKLSMNNLEQRIESIKITIKDYINQNEKLILNNFINSQQPDIQDNLTFNMSKLNFIGVCISNKLVYYLNDQKINRHLVKKIEHLSKNGHFNQNKSKYNLKNNYVLVSQTIKSLKKTSIIGVVKPSYLLPKEIDSTMSVVTRLSQLSLLSGPIKNMLLFIYLYFYFPILSLGILIFYLRSKSISSPIGELNEAVKSISRDDFNFRVEARGDDELAELVRSFKYMTKELLFNREKIRRMSQTEAWKDVAVRLAHELKNPLTPIKLANDRIGKELMKTNFDLYSDLLPSFNLISREIETIGALIKQFSQYSKDLNIHKSPTNMYQFMETLKDYLGNYSDVEWTFTNDIPKETKCFIDERGIRQVVNNLVGNAIESLEQSPQGVIKLKGELNKRESSNWLEISVFDNGLGIPENITKKMFEPYFTTKESGTGLGLAICEKIITRHNGRLTFKSAPHQTTFLIQIPILK